MTLPFPTPAESSPDLRTRLAVPRKPGETPPYSFPLVATIAPILGSGVIWAITQSPFALAFAFLGPAIALASLADAAIHRRRTRRKDQARFEADVEAALGRIAARHDTERAALDAAHPGVHRLLSGAATDVGRWVADARSPVPVVLGRGVVRSRLEIDGNGASEGVRDEDVARLLDSVLDAATRLGDAPIVIDARLGVGICGPRSSALATARSLVIQVARALTPGGTVVRAAAGADWDWLGALPHRLEVDDGHQAPGDRVAFLPDDGTTESPASPGPHLLIAIADRPGELPRGCGVVILAGSGGSASVHERRSAEPSRGLRLEYVSLEDALGYAETLRGFAAGEGLLPTGAAIPDLVRLASLPTSAEGSRQHNDGLSCSIGRDAMGEWEIDLVAEGPHAVIGGTTGSGKSELLITWILALAARYSPLQVTFLLVDFKGGASFSSIRSLPHSVGLITDLDQSSARRALESLRAEMLFRERALADAGVRAIDDLPDATILARLVIVVDEFAALAQDFPALHELFADLASRGRSLGVHLILCTQRPADALRDAILANCTLRISLRLNSRADSVAIVGTGDAAVLPRQPSGRAVVSVAGELPRPVQVALADAADAARIARLWPEGAGVRRPWCDPLPRMLPHVDLEPVAAGFAFGVSDLPGEQRQETAAYDPDRDGNLLVLGASAAGKTTTILALAESAGAVEVRRVPDDPAGAWDCIVDLLGVGPGPTVPVQPGPGHPGHGTARTRLLLLDDADLLLARFGQDHQGEFVGLLTRALREGPRQGTGVVLTAQRVPPMLQAPAALCDSRLLLRLASRQDHLLAGGRGDDHDPALPPGGGFWRGHRVQVAHLLPRPPVDPRPPLIVEFRPGAATAVVSSTPRAFVSRLAHDPALRIVDLMAGSRPDSDLLVADSASHVVIVGDPDAWQAAWSLFGTVRGTVPVIFDGCSVGDFRALTRSRRLPPPLSSDAGSVWLLTPDDELRRASLPLPPARPR